jgi:hypothetical protein
MALVIFGVAGILVYLALKSEFGSGNPLRDFKDSWNSQGEGIEEPIVLKALETSAVKSGDDVVKTTGRESGVGESQVIFNGWTNIFIYVGFVLIGLVIGFMMRPTIPSNALWENMGARGLTDDVQIPLNLIGIYLVNSEKVLYEFIHEGYIDNNQFASYNQVNDFLKSAFERSIWYPVFGGILGAIIAYWICRNNAMNKRRL